MRRPRWAGSAPPGCLAALCAAGPAARADDFILGDVLNDGRLYFPAPLRWDASDWRFFGGSVAAIAATRSADGRVRDHFAPAGPAAIMGADQDRLRDAAPAAAVVVGTWLIATVTNDSFGSTQAYSMLEAAGFSSLTAEAFRFAAGRERPDATTDANDWRASGSSCPSLHATAAFAIGAVFAESGSDDYRWFRHAVGYGMATATAYLRVHDNQHWLSDTVAGAALRIASGRFVTHRRLACAHDWNPCVLTSPYGGLQLSFNMIVN